MNEKQKLIERIQKYITGATVIDARMIEDCNCNANAEQPDEYIYPFGYRTDACSYEMRGAFTSGDPMWEEGDEEMFRRAMGEIEDA
jgi:hypothetical protein